MRERSHGGVIVANGVSYCERYSRNYTCPVAVCVLIHTFRLLLSKNALPGSIVWEIVVSSIDLAV